MCVKGRPTTVSEDQRTAQQWTVKVDGTELKKLGSGESVEIGRKPLRPLVDDGFARLDIMDANKSMSKRHAIFSVDAQGNASVRDLKSTNGSFVVADNGQLMRLPADEDFRLPFAPMTLQFGDVRVTFEHGSEHAVPETENNASAPVSNLFSYAVSDEVPQEPDAADMSVDDILNLRAGEPTALFNARNVANRVNFMQRAEHQSFAPVRSNEPDYGDLPSVSLVQHNVVADNTPRDLFADAVAEQHAAEEAAKKNAAENENEANQPEFVQETALPTRTATGNETEHDTIPVSKLFSARPSKPIIVALPAEENNMPEHMPEQQTETSHEQSNDEIVEQAATVAQQTNETPSQEETAPQQADDERFRPHAAQSQVADEPSPDETSVFKPTFEPGSVFDRVSKGELAKQEQTIEVDGMTSDDAKRTDDFTVQFEMARHPELLPFLAMNPSLYDDLYAWLGALGNTDIDAALSHNPGYAEYRKAVGK
ncbi:hypothetical protein CE168_02605 [Bifidobacterium sp. N5G01]|nr:hypothetical protein CE168_02605 [Bifidobacterium sp. N5G01]